ncbi:MAG: prepilin-type N-terminal cleavage/methylation domain-containing protein [Verrucomicrobiae bacterium]|nr:prepilin-type N-terminal cleavage/methylation domain-containing protein [Verrucomicrobiae bacterium]
MRIHSKSKAFTLVELLVTVAIVSLLAAMFTPALSATREKAKQIKCLNNLKQIVLACSIYAQDNNGVFSMFDVTTPAEQYWASRLYKKGYIKNSAVFACPSWPINSAASLSASTYGLRDFRTPTEYIVGDWLSAPVVLHLYNLPDPANYHLFADSTYGPLYSPATVASKQSHILATTPSLSSHGIHPRHNGTASVAFADGHAECCDTARLKAIGFAGGMNKDVSATVTY